MLSTLTSRNHTQVLVAESLEGALEQLRSDTSVGEEVERVFIIGGGGVYTQALSMKQVILVDIPHLIDVYASMHLCEHFE